MKFVLPTWLNGWKRWLAAGVIVLIFAALTGIGRVGFGWGGDHNVAVCHGGVFVVMTDQTEFSNGLYLRSEKFYLDWKPAYGRMKGLSRYVFVPLWPLGPAVWCGTVFSLVKRLRKKKAWQCGRCGYDMRGSAARCPECGANNQLLSF